ncbi:unnamed protein product [Dicrocoelium dendriticum]|nr:unnamed protein product [Dicrocoelium dendriticum]
MPKVFRPKLANPVVKAAPSQPAACSPKLDSRPKSLSPVRSPPARKDAYSIPKVNPIQPVVDIDQPVPEKQTIPVPDVGVELFSSKKKRHTSAKCNRDPCPAADQPLDRSSVSLRSLLHWIPTNKPPPSYRLERSNAPSSASSIASEKQEPNVKELPIKSSLASMTTPEVPPSQLDMLAPQLRLDANGNIVIDETSLLVSVQEETDRSHLRHVTEEGGVLGVTYNSFRRPRDRQRGRWTNRELIRFYRALSTVGPDFYLMTNLFPNRTRLELKRKFKRENRVNPYLVDQALRNRRSYDLAALVPLSDDDEDEDDIKPTVKTESQSTETKPLRKPRRRNPQPVNSDTLDEIIDSVLARYTRDTSLPVCPSNSSDASAPPSTSNGDLQTNELVSPTNPPTHVRAPGVPTLLQQMILHKQRQSESIAQSEVDMVEEPSEPPTSVSVPQPPVEVPRTRHFSSLSATDRLLQLSQSILGD